MCAEVCGGGALRREEVGVESCVCHTFLILRDRRIFVEYVVPSLLK